MSPFRSADAAPGILSAVLDSAVDAIVVIDERGRIEVVNPAAVRLFGYSEDELIGKNVSILMPSPYHEEHDGYIARYLQTREPRIIGVGREVPARRKDGSTFPVRLSVGEIAIGGTRRFTGILHDLSERVRIEEQLREQTSLVRLGEMAAVLAHEIKNPLAGVRGAIQVIGTRLPPESKDALMIREIIARIDGLNELVKDLLLFARPPQPRLAPVNVAALVTATASLLNSDPALKDVAVSVDVHGGASPTITADTALLTIVFENLLVNGAQAMGGKGAIQVAIDVHDTVCRVVLHDTGPGIAPDVLARIFTPFFTTKARGSGLGLPTAKRLVEAHGGTILIDCPPGGGTTVTVELPLQSESRS
jgi:two-component system sensor kinase FixL